MTGQLCISPGRLCESSVAIYGTNLDDTFEMSWNQSGIVAGLQSIGDVDVLALRGSKTAQDWLRDFNAVPAWHRQLGFVDAGFLTGMDDLYAQVRDVVGKNGRKLAMTGHSLGGAHARILAAMFTCDGLQVDMLSVYGSPKPGFVNLSRIIQKSGMVHLSFRNRNDVVPVTPLTIAPLFDYVHTEDWIKVDAAPEESNLEPLRDHAAELYQVGVSKLYAQETVH